MKLNTSGAWNALGQGLGQAASAVATVENYKYQKVEAARSNQYSINATNAKAQLDLAVKDWNVKNSVAMQSSGYNYQSAREELNTQLQGILDMQSSTWFDGDTEHSDRFTEEVFEPYLAQVGGILADNEAANINKRIQNKANDAIANNLDSLDYGSDPASIWESLKTAQSAYFQASGIDATQQALFTSSLMAQFNAKVISNMLSSSIDKSAITSEDTSKVIEAIQGNLSVDKDSDWGKLAIEIGSNLKRQAGKKTFTQAEVDTMKKVATSRILQRDATLDSNVVKNATTLYTEGLANFKLPSQLRNELDTMIDGIPEERRQKALQAATNVQATKATQRGYELYSEDKDHDLAWLTFQRKDIDSGYLNLTTFDGVPAVKDSILKLYDARIAEIKKGQEGLSDDQIATNKQLMNGTYQSLQSGSLSGREAISAMTELGMQTPGVEDNVYAMQLITKIKEDVVPAQYKALATQAIKDMDTTKFGFPINSKGKLKDQGDEGAYLGAKQWATEALADLFMDSAASDITPKIFADKVTEIRSVFFSKNLDILTSGEVKDKLFKDPIDDANTRLDMMTDIKPLFMDSDGSIKWANPDMKKTYDAIAGTFENYLKEAELTVMSASEPLAIDGEVYPTPTFMAKDANGVTAWYALNKTQMFASQDGKKTWVAGKPRDKKAKGPESDDNKVDKYFNQFRK